MPRNNIKKFIDQNQPVWAQLETLLNLLDKGKIDQKTLKQINGAYRKASAHLAFAQTYFPNHPLVDDLQDLIIRAHNLIYGKSKKNHWSQLVSFYTHEFPQLFFERIKPFLISFFLLFFGFLFAYIFTLINDDYAKYFLGILTPLNPAEIAQQEWNPALASSEIMVNNIQVAFYCFMFGALFGIGTVWILVFNGMMIGSLAALFSHMESSYIFGAYIWPHGVIELTAIFIAGAAGLSLAYRFFVPKDQTRYQSFTQEGKVTIKLLFGVIPMFVIAALIEGYITPAPIPHWAKYLFAVITLLLLIVYLGRPFFKEGIVEEKNK